MAEPSLLPERARHLWLLAAAPAIWSAHFLLSYVTAAIWCAKYAGPLGSLAAVRTMVGWYTAVALLGIALIGWHAFRRHRYGTATAPHDFDTPEDRHRFLGFATLLLAAVSGVATIFVALAAVFSEVCR